MRIAQPSSLLAWGLSGALLAAGVGLVFARSTPLGWWPALVPLLLIWWLGLRKPVRRLVVAKRPFPQEWRLWLSSNVPAYAKMPPARRTAFERDILFYLDEQLFEGIDGVVVTDFLRLSVAAGAALLLSGRPEWEFKSTRSVLLFPYAVDEYYRHSRESSYEGMAHSQGPVVLSVPAVEYGWARRGDGENVVLHELAHLLDFDDVYAPPARTSSKKPLPKWSDLVAEEMDRIRRGDSILRDYALTNTAEFFAVAVENLFERPALMAERHPELHKTLTRYFGYDPGSAL